MRQPLHCASHLIAKDHALAPQNSEKEPSLSTRPFNRHLFNRPALIAILISKMMFPDAMPRMIAPDPDLDSQFYEGVPMRRLVAFLVDLVIVFALWCVALLIGLVVTVATLGLTAPLVAIAAPATDFFYRWLMLSQHSATIGMRLTGIELRDSAGRKLDPAGAFLHVAGFYITIFFMPLLLISWVAMAVSPRHRMVHDLALGSVMINRPV